jgi:hypothetical protein
MILLPLLEFKRLASQRRPIFRVPNGREVASLTQLVAYLANRFAVGRASIWHWQSRYLQFGYAGLARSRRSDRGVSRFFKRHLALAIFVEEIVGRQQLSIVALHATVCAECERNGSAAPSYSTLNSYVKSRGLRRGAQS